MINFLNSLKDLSSCKQRKKIIYFNVHKTYVHLYFQTCVFIIKILIGFL